MRCLITLLLAAMFPLLSNAADLQAGQVWTYKTRAGEASSTLTVLKVEQYNDLGRVVHIRVDGIHMTNPVKGNVVTDIPHLPFKDLALQGSVVKQLRKLSSLPDFQEGYDTWKKAYLAGQAGAFETPVSTTLDAMLGAKWEEKK
ncbi:hypothetical protein LRH25_14540 [Ideonella azotifigens]|uniref:Uncharacterized protein n=1 Tax=Ideonella azotifigens TaxID=513160 RepID=A0ABN1K0L6_9BURK|nr:hypothetical protein [Ideonella azotifigens]MCD2341559.1 hypothetical protein [Ideonella azotifigens]